MTYQIDSTSLEDTLSLAAKIGSRLRGGEVIELVSDLGGGKTVFVRGLAKGMGSDDQVASPTFTISREYKAIRRNSNHFGSDDSKEEPSSRQSGTKKYSDGASAGNDEASVDKVSRITNPVGKQADLSEEIWLHHYDFYRLKDPGVVAAELEESINDSQVAVAIEWPEVIKGVLPDDRLTVTIKHTGDESRRLDIKAGKNHEHLIMSLAKP